MATFRRSPTAGAAYFFTVTTHQRQPVLVRQEFYLALKQSLRIVKESHPFTIEAFVLLPDHLHCIWTLPTGDADFSLRWSIIKRLVSQRTRHLMAQNISQTRERRRELGLWQRRFWEHQIRDDRDFEKHVEYIHWNPVKHGYAQAVAEWRYSSFHRFVERGLYPLDWAGSKPGDTDDGEYGEPA